MNIMHEFIRTAQAQQWVAATLVGLLFAVFLVLWVTKKLQEQASEEEYNRYFKRLDDAGKPKQ